MYGMILIPAHRPRTAMTLAEEISKNLRIRFIAIKTDDNRIKGKIAMYCDVLDISRQGFYRYLKHNDDPQKYEGIVEKKGKFQERMNVTTPMADIIYIRYS